MIFIIPVVIIVGILAWVLRPGKTPTTTRIVAILATVIPPIIVAIAAIVFPLLHNAAGKMWVSDISNTLFVVSLRLIDIAILASIAFAVLHKGEVARGLGFGICIAIVLSTVEFSLLEWLGGV